MSNVICLLLSCLYDGTILKVAIEIDGGDLKDKCYMEEYNREILYNKLPSYCQYPIIGVEPIFAMEVL